VHACAFKPFHMQQRSSSSCQTWKQLVCQGDYLQESALGTNHLYRFRDVKPHFFVWNRLPKKIQTGLRLNRSRGEGDDYLQKFFGRNSVHSCGRWCRITWILDSLLTSKKLPKSKTGFRERKAVKEFNQSGRDGRGNKRKKKKQKDSSKSKNYPKNQILGDEKQNQRKKSRRVEKQSAQRPETHKRKNTVGKNEEDGVALKGDIR